jgi:hypothetical protein
MILLLTGFAVAGDMSFKLGRNWFGIILYILDYLFFINAILALINRIKA